MGLWRKFGTSMIGLLATTWLVGAAAAEPAAKKTAAKPSTVVWQNDLKAAQKQAAKTGRPMMIVFGAEWCTHCNKFEQNTLTNPTMAAFINKEFVPVRLDFDKEQETAQILEVEALPCTVILSPEADLLGRVVGAKQPKDFWEVLQDARDEQTRIRQARFAASGAPERQ